MNWEQQRRQVAWGESNERQRGWCNPRLRNAREALPAAIEINELWDVWIQVTPINGRVEIAYFTLPRREGQGIATEMARQLVRICQQADQTVSVFAQTLPEQNASTSILKKLGFTLVGRVEHPDDGTVWEWTLNARA